MQKIAQQSPVFMQAVVCLGTLLVYGAFLGYGHISWDDPEMVFRNPDVQHFDLKAFFSNTYVGNYIPVTMLFHSLAWAIGGASDWVHHLLNILLHLVNGLLVYRIGKKLFQAEMISLAAMVIFLLHPLQIESVGWISELKNVLSATWSLLCIQAYMEFARHNKKSAYLLAALYFILACLSKPSAVVLPLALLCFDLLMNNRIGWKQLFNKTPLLILSLIAGVVNLKAQEAAMFINYAHQFPMYQRIGLAGLALLKYFALFIAPVKLSVIYPYPVPKSGNVVLGFSMLLALGILITILFRKNQSGLAALILFCLIHLVLVLQIIPFGEVLYADRYMYIPLIGLGFITGRVLNAIRIPYRTMTAILLVLFSVLTFSRVLAWKSAIRLYEDIIRKYPDNFVALNSAGVESMLHNNDEKALEYMDRAVQSAPRNYKGYYNRGLLYLKNKRPREALQSFNACIALYEYAKAYVGRASAYYMVNDLPKAVNDASHAVALDPGNARAYFVLGNSYNELNELEKAIGYYNKAIAIQPAEPDYFFKRAVAYGKQQRFKACFDDLQLCIALNPEYWEAYYWRGVAKVNLRQPPCPDLEVAARHHYEPAVIAYDKYCR